MAVWVSLGGGMDADVVDCRGPGRGFLGGDIPTVRMLLAECAGAMVVVEEDDEHLDDDGMVDWMLGDAGDAGLAEDDKNGSAAAPPHWVEWELQEELLAKSLSKVASSCGDEYSRSCWLVRDDGWVS